MDEFKYAIFAFEVAGLPFDQQVVQKCQAHFATMPSAGSTLFKLCSDMDEAGAFLDDFKAKTCGSAFNLALINLNGFPSMLELEFLMRGHVLGNPPTVFLTTLRTNGQVYGFAKDKVEQDNAEVRRLNPLGVASCIDTYSPATADEAALRNAKLLDAFLEDIEERAQNRAKGILSSRMTRSGELIRMNRHYFTGGARHTTRFLRAQV